MIESDIPMDENIDSSKKEQVLQKLFGKRNEVKESNHYLSSEVNMINVLLWIATAISLSMYEIDFKLFDIPIGIFISAVFLTINTIYTLSKHPQTYFQKAHLALLVIMTIIVSGPFALLILLIIVVYDIRKIITMRNDENHNEIKQSSQDLVNMKEKEDKIKQDYSQYLSLKYLKIVPWLLWIAITISFCSPFVIENTSDTYKIPTGFIIGIVLLAINSFYSFKISRIDVSQKRHADISFKLLLLCIIPLIIVSFLFVPYLLIIPAILFIIYKITKMSDNKIKK